jgi:hypothetical protein
MTDYALVIGIDDYLKEELGPLSGAAMDAEAVYQWLIHPEGGRLDPENCLKVISPIDPRKPVKEETDLRPIKKEIEEVLEKIIRKAKKNPADNNCLYFYFAGHGLGVEIDIQNLDSKDNALCMANWSDLRRNAALSTTKYKNTFTSFGLFRQTVLLADCCRNTRINVNPQHSDLAPGKPGPYVTRFFIAYATQPRASSYETTTKQGITRGIFTKVLLDGLQGGASTPSGTITALSVGKYLKKYTPIEAQRWGCFQEPQLIFDFLDDQPMVITHLKRPLTANCHITLTPDHKIVMLLDGKLEVIDTLERKSRDTFDLQLPKGIYLLQDGQQEKSFSVNPAAREPVIVNF